MKHADVSLNTELEVICALSSTAGAAKRTHGVLLMVELGDLREGIMPGDLHRTVRETKGLPNITLRGIGTNLACHSGVSPDAENMSELSSLACSIEARFGLSLDIVSGGNSANLGWALGNEDTGRINDLRLGEAILLGREPLHREPIAGLHTDAISLIAEVIESKVKPSQPWGEIGQTAFGDAPAVAARGEASRALLAIGHQDTDPGGLKPPAGLQILGASSDHLILNSGRHRLAIGAEVSVQVNYQRARSRDDLHVCSHGLPQRCRQPPCGHGQGGHRVIEASSVPWALPATRGADAATPRVEWVGQEPVALLDGGRQAYPRMLQAIAGARHTVHLEMYAFAKTGTGAVFVGALADAARRGVRVRVHIDGWGSAHGGREVAGALRDAGCTVRIYNRLRAMIVGRFGRNHRKVMVVDDQVAFIGGINIGDENVSEGVRLGWADLAVEIRGPQCRALAGMIRRKSRVLRHGALRIDFCGLGGGWRLRRQYLEAIAGARHRIDLAHAYFLPDRGIIRALTRASRRGVAVCLLLAGRSDIPFARAATRGLYRRLLAAGIQIREWEGSVLHAKVATIDGRLLVGSFNLDPFSLVNHEALVQVVDRDVVGRGQAWITDYFARSRVITAVEASSRLHRWLFEPLGYLLAALAATTSRMIAGRSQRDVPHDARASSGKTTPPILDPAEVQR